MGGRLEDAVSMSASSSAPERGFIEFSGASSAQE
jgi:hypothetical protein